VFGWSTPVLELELASATLTSESATDKTPTALVAVTVTVKRDSRPVGADAEPETSEIVIDVTPEFGLTAIALLPASPLTSAEVCVCAMVTKGVAAVINPPTTTKALAVVDTPFDTTIVPFESIVAVPARADDVSTASTPTLRALASEVVTAAVAVSELLVATLITLAPVVLFHALAAGVETTESSPAPSAVTAASAMRLRSVFVDILFLSLVSCGNFPKLARRSVKIF